MVFNRFQKRKIVELKPEWKEKLTSLSGIKIGDSMSASETFLPKVDFLDDMVFIDIAGLNDASGRLIEFINRFMLRKLF